MGRARDMLQITAMEGVSVQYKDFAVDGSASTLLVIPYLSGVVITNESGGTRTFTFQEGNAAGGWKEKFIVVIKDSETKILSFVPFQRCVDSKLRLLVDTATPSYDVALFYIDLSQFGPG